MNSRKLVFKVRDMYNDRACRGLTKLHHQSTRVRMRDRLMDYSVEGKIKSSSK